MGTAVALSFLKDFAILTLLSQAVYDYHCLRRMPQPNTPPTVVSISTATIIRVVVALLIVWAFYLVVDVVVLLLAALLLAAALGPLVDRLESHHVPRTVSVLTIYAIMLAVLSLAIVLIIPPVAGEVRDIAQAFPLLYSRLTAWLGGLNLAVGTEGGNGTLNGTLQDLSPAVSVATRGVFSIVAGVFGGLVSFLLVLVMTFYLVVDEAAIKQTVAIAPPRHRTYLTGLINRLQARMGVWLRAQLILMGIIGLLTYTVLTAIGMPYALVLALIAGLLEFIPYLGPLLSAVPGVFLAYAVSPTMAIVVAGVYYGIQLLENNVIVPKVMEKALGLSPIISIVVFLVGAKLAGFAGVFLAIPIATAAMVVAQDLLANRNGVAAGSEPR